MGSGMPTRNLETRNWWFPHWQLRHLFSRQLGKNKHQRTCDGRSMHHTIANFWPSVQEKWKGNNHNPSEWRWKFWRKIHWHTTYLPKHRQQWKKDQRVLNHDPLPLKKRHSACNEVGLSTATITTKTLVKDLLCHSATSNVDKVAPRSNTNCFGQTDPHGTTTTSSHATAVLISKADNMIPHNDQSFWLSLSTKSVNCRLQISSIEVDWLIY